VAAASTPHLLPIWDTECATCAVSCSGYDPQISNAPTLVLGANSSQHVGVISKSATHASQALLNPAYRGERFDRWARSPGGLSISFANRLKVLCDASPASARRRGTAPNVCRRRRGAASLQSRIERGDLLSGSGSPQKRFVLASNDTGKRFNGEGATGETATSCRPVRAALRVGRGVRSASRQSHAWM